MEESDRYRMPTGTTTAPPAESASNGYRRYSIGESGNESGSDTTALQSNQHVKRTNSFTKKGKSSSTGGFNPDRILFQAEDDDDSDEDDLALHLNSDAYDPQRPPSADKVPLVSYKKTDSRHSRTSAKSKSTAQPKRQGDYGRISHDSFHSGYSEEHEEEEDDRDDFGQEEEDVGMMTGNRTNRSGIGNGGGGGHGLGNEDAKLPDHGGSLFNSFLNMANSIIGAGK